MAINVLHEARDMHAVRSTTEYRACHAAFIRKASNRGRRIEVHESTTVVTARVDHGRWIADCECEAGNAVDMPARIALCFGCGAVHVNVIVPSAGDLARIEATLLARPRMKTRNWSPSQSIDALEAETPGMQ